MKRKGKRIKSIDRRVTDLERAVKAILDRDKKQPTSRAATRPRAVAKTA